MRSKKNDYHGGREWSSYECVRPNLDFLSHAYYQGYPSVCAHQKRARDVY